MCSITQMKQTAVEWLESCLIEQYPNGKFVWNTRADIEALFKRAKEMERQQQGYSEEEVFRLLDALWDSLDILYNNPEHEYFTLEHWFNNFKKNKTSQEQINSIIDVLNTQGSVSEGDMPVLIDNDCKCDKCGKESRGSHSCPYDEEFNSGYSDSCNCCDSCRRECLMDI